ncbi:MAG: GxxExxY protein [Acidobacteria bacterium]|nr:GxxExxY protein [Acidobacteriota bacterium]
MQDNDPLTAQIIGCAYLVANGLGSGFLEKVYENALAHELRKAGLKVCLLMNFGRPNIEIRRLMMDQGSKSMEPVMNGDGQ